jgi:hypothetical protein
MDQLVRLCDIRNFYPYFIIIYSSLIIEIMLLVLPHWDMQQIGYKCVENSARPIQNIVVTSCNSCFNSQQFCILHSQHILVFHIIFRISCNYFCQQHETKLSKKQYVFCMHVNIRIHKIPTPTLVARSI